MADEPKVKPIEQRNQETFTQTMASSLIISQVPSLICLHFDVISPRSSSGFAFSCHLESLPNHSQPLTKQKHISYHLSSLAIHSTFLPNSLSRSARAIVSDSITSVTSHNVLLYISLGLGGVRASLDPRTEHHLFTHHQRNNTHD